MKCIIVTTGMFSLLTPYGEHVRPTRPTVVRRSSFIDSRIFKKELKLLVAELPEEASDEDFVQVWKESKKTKKNREEFAAQAYAAEFEVEVEESVEPAPNTEPSSEGEGEQSTEGEQTNAEETNEQGAGNKPEDNSGDSSSEETGKEGSKEADKPKTQKVKAKK